VSDEAAERRTKPSDRQALIAQLARQGGFLTTRELSDRLNVSEMTIRRDVAALAAAGQIRSVFGGAAGAGDEFAGGIDFQERSRSNTEAKVRIGHAAAELVRSGSLIAVDNGTTTIEMARALGATPGSGIVTTSLPVINILNERGDIDVTSLGGVLQPELQAFAGPLTLASVEQIHVSQFFLAASAVRQNGVYCANQYDSLTKRALVKAADEVVLLADSTKFERADAMMKVVALEDIDTVITDDALTAEARRMLEDLGVGVIQVSASARSGGPR
jgi:DeoR/GlpR family transcriptional regulator of sugar metabolism